VHRTFLRPLSRLLGRTRSSLARDFNDPAITDLRVESMRIPNSLLSIFFLSPPPASIWFISLRLTRVLHTRFSYLFLFYLLLYPLFHKSNQLRKDSLNSQHFELHSKCSEHAKFQELNANQFIIEILEMIYRQIILVDCLTISRCILNVTINVTINMYKNDKSHKTIVIRMS